MKHILPFYTIIIFLLFNSCDKDSVISDNENNEDIKDNPTYQLVWNDEFNGNELDLDKWNVEIGGTGWGNNELQYYTSRPENVRLEQGCLIIEGRTVEQREGEAARLGSDTQTQQSRMSTRS